MGKRMKIKARNPHKLHSQASTGSASASLDPSDPKGGEGVEGPKDREQCSHYAKGSTQLNQVLLGILSSKEEVVACEHCREEPNTRRGGGKEKGKQQKKKGGPKAAEASLESHKIWVCLDCGRYFCGGAVSDSVPYGHARWHLKQDRHSLTVRSDNPSVAWCFSCNAEVPIEIPEGAAGEDAKPAVDGKAVEHQIKPSASDSAHGYVIRGLLNLGNTCFFNSVLQNLLAVDMLREHMTSLDSPIGPLTMALKKLFMETSGGADSRGALSLKNLFGSICSKAPQFRGYQQQDSHELLRYLLDGLLMEETTARKLQDSSGEQEKVTPSSVATMVESIFGGQLSSTVSCMECGHTSVVHEPFLDLSLPVPSKKPPLKNVPPPPPKRSKPPARDKGRSRRFREKESLKVSQIEESNEPTVPASDPEQNATVNVDEPSECNESCASISNPEEKTIRVEDDSWWMDYLDPIAGPDEANSEPQPCENSTNDGQILHEKNHLHCILDSQIPACPQNDGGGEGTSGSKTDDNGPKEQALSSDYCGENFIVDTVPSSGVILLPYTESGPSVKDDNVAASCSLDPAEETDASVKESSVQTTLVVGDEQEVDFDGFGDLFNEPEVTSEPKTETGQGDEIDVMFWNSNSTDFNQDEVDDSNAPVSVDSCMALFTKPELLTGEHAWHCGRCCEVLYNEMEKKKDDVLGNGKAVPVLKNLDMQTETPNDASVAAVVPQTINNQAGESESNRYEKEADTQESSGSEYTNACSIQIDQDLGCGEVVPINQERAKRSKAPGKAHQVQPGKDKGNESEKIKVMRGSMKRFLVSKAPPILTVHLKRFSQDARGRLSKLRGHVNFQEVLDLRPYTDPRSELKERCGYRLVGVVEHSGSMGGGHYVAYVRVDRIRGRTHDGASPHSWFYASDALVREVSVSEVLRSEAYILFYERV